MDKGNTVLVIEHNMDVIKVADHVIDLGPEGGDAGGEILFAGTPEDLARQQTYTSKYLAEELGRQTGSTPDEVEFVDLDLMVVEGELESRNELDDEDDEDDEGQSAKTRVEDRNSLP